MKDIFDAPIFLRLGARMRGPSGVPVGESRRVIISYVIAYNVASAPGLLIKNIPGHPMQDIKLKDIMIYYNSDVTAGLAKRKVPELEKRYPQPGSLGMLPAYGIFTRHVDGLNLMMFL